MKHRPDFDFEFSDSLLAEAAGISQKDLHFDVGAILRAHQAVEPIAKSLRVEPPRPKLPGFAYTHVAALGAEITFGDFEPSPSPILKDSHDIDNLREPADYLASGLIQQRLRLWRELKEHCPDAPNSIGHLFEGPITTAVLLLGPDFFLLPYDDPARAHRLLDFCVSSALHYAGAITDYFEKSPRLPGDGFPDDFAGILPPAMFEEFVVPYWERIYAALDAPVRNLHSELLRVEHLKFLKDLHIDFYDPAADQYLTPELLRRHCPARFRCAFLDWHVANLTESELRKRYQELASFEPAVIGFSLNRLQDLPKIRALLEVARDMRDGSDAQAKRRATPAFS